MGKEIKDYGNNIKRIEPEVNEQFIYIGKHLVALKNEIVDDCNDCDLFYEHIICDSIICCRTSRTDNIDIKIKEIL